MVAVDEGAAPVVARPVGPQRAHQTTEGAGEYRPAETEVPLRRLQPRRQHDHFGGNGNAGATDRHERPNAPDPSGGYLLGIALIEFAPS